ncbi:hypothetical protein A5662_03545 [Mycobacteriaceae bacterium 1482268.1]|nr:hypothetical protein A5662_03545 [Mycobacteriaceae bacterium 1482268.1]
MESGAHQYQTHGLTLEQVRGVAFSKPGAGERGYNEYEVDAFLDRVEAALRDPARRGLTSEEVRGTTFPKAPRGRSGYNEAEVDAFVARVGKHMSSQPRAATRSQPARCVLYSAKPATWAKPMLALDVGKDLLHVVDLNRGALVASVSLSEVAVKQGQHGGISVMAISGPGLDTLTVRPHIGPDWRRRTKTKKPTYFATDEEWVMLAEKLGMGPDLVDEFVPQTFLDNVLAFFEEANPSVPTTWRTPFAFGLLAFVLVVFVPAKILFLLIGVGLMAIAALAWRFNWRI